MRPTRHLCVAACCCSLSLVAQKRNTHVVLPGFVQTDQGDHISFATGQPEILGQMPLTNSESSASISDTSGVLQFCTAAGMVYDRYGAVMEQGNLFLGINGDVTQGSLIFPRPGNADLYDVLYIRDTPFTAQLVQASWVVVDMSMNTGLGAVVSNAIFGQQFTEKLTGTPHANGVDYWAVMHEWGSSTFRAYGIGQTGLDTVPVLSSAGSPHMSTYGDCGANMNFQGEMKLSYDGTRLALCNTNHSCDSPFGAVVPSIVQLFHFDDSTGEVSYWMDLPGHRYSYGLDFPQDGSKLYVSGADSLVHYVDQYDLSNGDTSAIAASRFRVFASPYALIYNARPTAMAFAPDGRLYVSHLNNAMDVIENPDGDDASCGYSGGSLVLPSTHHHSNHWNQLKRYHDSEYKRDDVGFGAEPKVASFAIWPNPAISSIRLKMPANIALPRVGIHDNTGRLLREVSGQVALSSTVDVSGLASGMYTVSLLDGSAVVGQARLVVQ